MKWLKILWGWIWKKNILSQDKVSKKVIESFAKKLDDVVDFHNVFKGKISWLEAYDDWAFTQVIVGFIAFSGDKFSDEFWTKFETCLALFNNGHYEQASIIISKDLNKLINTGIPQNAEEFILQRQTLFIFELAAKVSAGDFKERV